MKTAPRLFYTNRATKDLDRLDPHVALRITDKIERNSQLSNPLVHARHIAGSEPEMFRYRIGDYRVIFDVDDEQNVTILTILRVRHRKDAYRTPWA